MNERPLIAHVLYRLDTGGMERILVSLVHATRDRYRHAVIVLAGFGALRAEIEHAVTACISLDKRPGKDWPCYGRLWRTLRHLKPDLVQTYNLGTLDLAPVVKLAGVRRLVHAEHGRDAADPRGDNPKYQRLRRWMAPCIDRFVVVSSELDDWLVTRVGIARSKVVFIANGIDTAAFAVPRDVPHPRSALGGFAPPGCVLIGNVARLDAVKDHAGLIQAFKLLREQTGAEGLDCRLAIAGDGPERVRSQQQIDQLGLAGAVCLLGNRGDVAELLAECDVFALSSRAEGMPLTVLEAMAAGLPVVATDVGSVGDVVVAGTTGALVAPSDPAALATALARYVRDAGLRHRHGEAGRARVVARFGLPMMVSAYTGLYDQLLADGRKPRPASPHVALAQRREP